MSIALLPPGASRTTVAGHAALIAGDGPPVLLVPGFSGSKEDFALVLPGLAAAGRRAVAIDLPGQLDTPGPDDPAAYSVDALAAGLLEVARELGGVDLVGHSLGGLVARAAVLADPGPVRTLVLMSSGPAAIGGPRAALLALMRPLLEAGDLEGIADAADALAQQDTRRGPQSDELRAFLRRRWTRSSAAGLLGAGDALLAEPDRTPALADAGVPLLVLLGEHDDAWPPDLQREMAARLRSAVHVVAGAWHSPAAEEPTQTVHALLRFWGAAGEGR